jgi:inorganic pyrophosphatase
MTDVAQLSRAVIDRLRHYFLTYKAIPGESSAQITVDPIYSAMEARAVLRAARRDYALKFEGIETPRSAG